MADPLFEGLEAKEDRLKGILAGMEGAVLAFSGGVDSSCLLAVAVNVMGPRLLAVTVKSPVHPEAETRAARELAAQLGARYLEVCSDELKNPRFKANPPDRCYHCKGGRALALLDIAAREGFAAVMDGTNADDGDDYRPGHRALLENGIRSPLAEAGLTKAEIRELSRRLGLPTWARPAMACLATRFPYGVEITSEGLGRVERAESALYGLGLKILRVRAHGEVGRVETSPEEFALAAGPLREKIAAALKEAGFAYAALDLTGYRSGSMNETLGLEG